MPLNNFTTTQQLLDTANTNTSGAFWPSMFFLAISIFFLGFLNYGFEIAALVSLFIGIIIGTILVYMDLIPLYQLGIVVGLELFLFIYLMFSSPKNR